MSTTIVAIPSLRNTMIFAVRFHDKPDQLILRNALLQAHLDWLALHRDAILIAGSLREAPNQGAVGGFGLSGPGIVRRLRPSFERIRSGRMACEIAWRSTVGTAPSMNR
uniref:hypothetical protein n=1 Tax=Cupriavidus taiwanensis TaxID=164546 RepID=UPI001E41B3F1|nr:hypothetical protein [Cupriavidus taiwanensis]